MRAAMILRKALHEASEYRQWLIAALDEDRGPEPELIDTLIDVIAHIRFEVDGIQQLLLTGFTDEELNELLDSDDGGDR
jgi:hypothetical protein